VSAGVVVGPGTMHYSWPKAAAILGLGSSQLVRIPVDLDARMDVDLLRAELDRCLDEKQPVIQVVAVVGSTEESAVDPLSKIVAVREEDRRSGLDFPIHVDAAASGCRPRRGASSASPPSAGSVAYTCASAGSGRRIGPRFCSACDHFIRAHRAGPR
jgi:hypothetical protein